MGRRTVECLRCGATREAAGPTVGECPHCGYLGWARPSELTDVVRRALRERPPEFRRFHPA